MIQFKGMKMRSSEDAESVTRIKYKLCVQIFISFILYVPILMGAIALIIVNGDAVGGCTWLLTLLFLTFWAFLGYDAVIKEKKVQLTGFAIYTMFTSTLVISALAWQSELQQQMKNVPPKNLLEKFLIEDSFKLELCKGILSVQLLLKAVISIFIIKMRFILGSEDKEQ